MLSGDYDAQPSRSSLLAESWQATVILGLVVGFHPTGSLNVVAVLLGVLPPPP
jgi:hypothetical protein